MSQKQLHSKYILTQFLFQIWQLLTIYLLCSTSLAQDYVQPDVSFTDINSRFDLTEMMGAQDRAHKDIPIADDDDAASDDDFRRHRAKKALTRRADGDFAYHDRMDSKEGGTLSDFEENLKQFQPVKGPSRRFFDDQYRYKRFRRNADDTESEVLMNHVVPFNFKVDGYLKPPLL
uniref:Uncharacterized protein n=1 Tax=Heliothis virescens TaxID=7102 RepID=A0A2A4J3E1_HELVI